MADSTSRSALAMEQTIFASNTTSTVQVSQLEPSGNGFATIYTVTEEVDLIVSSQSATPLPIDAPVSNLPQSTSSNNPIKKLARNFKRLRSKTQKTKEQRPSSSEDASKPKLWNFITGKIFSTKTKIHKTLQKLTGQDAELASANEERTIKSVNDTVVPQSQSPEQTITEIWAFASTLAAAATNITVTSGNLHTGTAGVYSKVLVNDNLVARKGSLPVKTTRAPHKATTLQRQILPQSAAAREGCINCNKEKKNSRNKFTPVLTPIKDGNEEEEQSETNRSTPLKPHKKKKSPRLKKFTPVLSPIPELPQPKIKFPTPRKSLNKQRSPCLNKFTPVLSQIQELPQPGINLPTPPESPKTSISKEDSPLAVAPPNSPKDNNSNSTTVFPFLVNLSLHANANSLVHNPIAISIDAEGSRIQQGLPPYSETLAKFVNLNRERMTKERKIAETMGDVE